MKRAALSRATLLAAIALLIVVPMSMNAQSQIVKQRAKEVREKVETRNAPAKPAATNNTPRAQSPAKPASAANAPSKTAQPAKPAASANAGAKPPQATKAPAQTKAPPAPPKPAQH